MARSVKLTTNYRSAKLPEINFRSVKLTDPLLEIENLRAELLALINSQQPTNNYYAGVDGKDGKDGVAGPKGLDGRDGKDGTGFSWKGNWEERASYEIGDVVNYLGSSYVANAPSTNEYPNRVNNSWDLMVASGASGARGPQGEVLQIGAPTFIQDDEPDYDGSYVWVQTGLGETGGDYTVWYNIC